MDRTGLRSDSASARCTCCSENGASYLFENMCIIITSDRTDEKYIHSPRNKKKKDSEICRKMLGIFIRVSTGGVFLGIFLVSFLSFKIFFNLCDLWVISSHVLNASTPNNPSSCIIFHVSGTNETSTTDCSTV